MKSSSTVQSLKIGLSLPCTEAAELQLIHDIPQCFELLELYGDVINSFLQLRKDSALWQEFEVINYRDILPASLAEQLTTSTPAIINSCKKQLRELFKTAAQCNAETVSIDPDWEALCNDENRRSIFDGLLRSTSGDREFYKQTLTIAVRVPSSGDISIAESVHLLHKLSNYRVKLALDINPHELLNSKIDWQRSLQLFRFDTACVRFCYSSELGNKLLYKHIEPIVKVLKSWKRELPVYIAPSGKADLDELAGMISEITCESEQK